MNPVALVGRIDDLYRTAVMEPGTVDDRLLGDWAEVAFDEAQGDRTTAKPIRLAVRTARKLARYWTEHDPTTLPNWRNGVDEALGGLGWRAQLGVLDAALEAAPTPEVFELKRDLHRAVHFAEWMEGVGYEEWLSGRG